MKYALYAALILAFLLLFIVPQFRLFFDLTDSEIADLENGDISEVAPIVNEYVNGMGEKFNEKFGGEFNLLDTAGGIFGFIVKIAAYLASIFT